MAMEQMRIIYAMIAVAVSEFMMGLWAGWPSWALMKRSGGDTPAEWLSRSDHTWAVASLDLANVASAWPARWIADRLGRRGCLVAVGVTLFASFVTLYAPGRWAVFAARSMAGISKSVVYATVPGFVAEISADKARGRLAVAVAVSDSLGMLAATVAGPRVSYAAMNAASLALVVAYMVAVSRLPETPRRLLMWGRRDDAARAYRWYRPGVTAAAAARELARAERSVLDDMSSPGTYRELFSDDGNRAALLLVAGAYLAQRLGGVGCVAAYTVDTVPAGGPVRPGDAAAAFPFVRLLFTVAAVPLIDRLGRRPLLIGSHACLAAVSAAYAACLYGDPAAAPWAPVTCVVLFTVAYSMGAGVVPAALCGEMFPANVQSRAVSLVAVVASAGSAAASVAYLPVADAYGVYVMFAVFCAVNAAWAACAHLFLFETNGKSLSAIQRELDEYNSTSSSSSSGSSASLHTPDPDRPTGGGGGGTGGSHAAAAPRTNKPIDNLSL